MPSQKPAETPTKPRKAAGYRDTTRSTNAPQRATEGAQTHARKTTERLTRSNTAPKWVSFRSLFVLFRWELAETNFAELIFDLLKSPFCEFSENEKVIFLSRFLRRHQVEVHQPPRNQDNAVALLPGLLLHRADYSV